MATLGVGVAEVKIDEFNWTPKPILEVKPLEPTTRYVIDGKYMDEVEEVKVEKPKQEAVEEVAVSNGFDIDKLAYAVAMAETGNCTRGMGLTKNNAFGIMTWERGFREGRTYEKCEDSYVDFKQIWSDYYGEFPTRAMAERWTGKDSVDTWLKSVKQYYYQ